MIHIKDWKMAEIKKQHFGCFVESINGIVKETEKAVCISMTIGWASSLIQTINVWCPKSAILTEEEYLAECQKQEERFQAGAERYNNLVAFAKEHGVKGVRVGMRTETIINKIHQAGLEY